MRKTLIALMLVAVAVTGCGIPALPISGLGDLFSSIGACDVYDSNSDGVVTAEEVREVFDLFGFPHDAYSDQELLEALQVLGCTTQ